MKTKFVLAAIAALFATASAAPAGAADGLYASVGGLLSIPSSSTPQLSTVGAPRQLDVTFQAGWGARGALGYAFPDFRTEVEIGYRKSSVGHVDDAKASGSQGVFDTMANVVFDVGHGMGFQPYLGAGIGAAWGKWSNVQSGPSAQLGAALPVFNDHSPTAFAYQGIAGVSFAVAPATEVFADYRYIGTTAMTFKSTSPVGYTIGEHKDASHNLLLGVRFAFGA